MAPFDDVRREVRDFLAAEWDPERPLLEWRGLLADAGWACPSWPREWFGRGLPAVAADAVAAELEAKGAVGPPQGAGMGLAAPTLLEHGSDELKRELLRPTITGEATWCQLFSEPGNGSDLAGITTRADRDGDQWIVNGQKVWTTSAHHARFGLLLARTDWDVPKHRGLTYFVLELDQPGVEVRPLRQMNGYASFNEVFLSDAVLPASRLVGTAGRGWAVALATLAHERRFDLRRRQTGPARQGRTWTEALAEQARTFEPYRWYPQRAGRSDLLVEQAQALGRRDDPLVRQDVARTLSLVRAAEWTMHRAAAARRLGRPPGAEGSIGKLASSMVAKASADAHGAMAGAAGQLTGADGSLDGTIAEILVSVPAVSIAGGTDEIQHNILGERMLGLPKEPSVDTDIPFRQVRRN